MKIKKWNLKLDGIPKNCLVISLHDGFDGLKITLISEDELDKKKEFVIHFENYLGYRNFNESERLKLWEIDNLTKVDWSYFIISESELTNWIVDESFGIVSKDEVTHFLITTQEDIIDIISYVEPNLYWVK